MPDPNNMQQMPAFVKHSTDLVLAQRSYQYAANIKDRVTELYRESIAPYVGQQVIASFVTNKKSGAALEETFSAEYAPVVIGNVQPEFVTLQLLQTEGGIYYVPYINLRLHGLVQ